MIPNLETQKSYILDVFGAYWPKSSASVSALPVPRIGFPDMEPLPPRLEPVTLPDWAADIGCEGHILVPKHRLLPGTVWKLRKSNS